MGCWCLQVCNLPTRQALPAVARCYYGATSHPGLTSAPSSRVTHHSATRPLHRVAPLRCRRNPLASAPKDNASLCPSATAPRRSGRALLAEAGGPPATDVLSVLPAWLAISSLGTLGVGFAYLYLFQRHSTAMTHASIGVQVRAWVVRC